MVSEQVGSDIIEIPSFVGKIGDLEPIRILQADTTEWESVWNQLMQRHHYLGYRKMVGTRMKYIVISNHGPIALLGWRAASLKLEARDAFIGWSLEQKRTYLPQVINNARFLILPSIQVPNLGSYVLTRVIEALRKNWLAKYGCRPLLLETFVDPRYFDGAVYRAANWIHIGRTKGYTKQGHTYRYHGHSKDVYVYPVEPDFRAVIGCSQKPLRKRRKREGFDMMLQTQQWDANILQEAGITDESIDLLAKKVLDFHDYFKSCFNRCTQHEYSIAYLMGLMSDLDRKSAEPIALRYLGEKKVRSMQRFITEYSWDDQKIEHLYRLRLSDQIASEDSVISLDSSEYVKKGKESVGTARQYCGRLGKIENCQSGIFLGYASSSGYGLLDRQLYLPEIWFSEGEYKLRNEQCRIPKEMKFQTKPQIARCLLENIKQEGLFPSQWLACDATFGGDQEFIDAIGEEYWYMADIRSNTHLWLEWPEVAPAPYKGRGRKPSKLRAKTPSKMASEIAKDPSLTWKTVTLADGAKGPIVAEVTRLRVVTRRDDLPYQEVWLLLRRWPDGSIKYSLSNCPEDTPLTEMIRVSALRWPIEQCFQEGKSFLGMAHYETRSWPAWHRHMLYVFLAHLFLLEVRLEFKKKQIASLS